MEGKHIDVILAGSLARNTHLKGDRDIDIFVVRKNGYVCIDLAACKG